MIAEKRHSGVITALLTQSSLFHGFIMKKEITIRHHKINEKYVNPTKEVPKVYLGEKRLSTAIDSNDSAPFIKIALKRRSSYILKGKTNV